MPAAVDDMAQSFSPPLNLSLMDGWATIASRAVFPGHTRLLGKSRKRAGSSTHNLLWTLLDTLLIQSQQNIDLQRGRADDVNHPTPLQSPVSLRVSTMSPSAITISASATFGCVRMWSTHCDCAGLFSVFVDPQSIDMPLIFGSHIGCMTCCRSLPSECRWCNSYSHLDRITSIWLPTPRNKTPHLGLRCKKLRM